MENPFGKKPWTEKQFTMLKKSTRECILAARLQYIYIVTANVKPYHNNIFLQNCRAAIELFRPDLLIWSWNLFECPAQWTEEIAEFVDLGEVLTWWRKIFCAWQATWFCHHYNNLVYTFWKIKCFISFGVEKLNIEWLY